MSGSILLLLPTQASAKAYVCCTTPEKGYMEYGFVLNSLQVAI